MCIGGELFFFSHLAFVLFIRGKLINRYSNDFNRMRETIEMMVRKQWVKTEPPIDRTSERANGKTASKSVSDGFPFLFLRPSHD